MLTHPTPFVKIKLALAIILIILFNTGASVFAAEENEEGQVKILARHGVISTYKEGKYVALEESASPALTDRIKVGETASQKEILQNPDLLGDSYLVLSLSKRDMITLSNGTIIQRRVAGKARTPEYLFDGVGHILFKKSRKPYNLKINGIPLQTTGVNIYFNSLKDYLSLVIVEGKAVMYLKGKGGKSQKGTVKAGNRLLVAKTGFKLEQKYDRKKDAHFVKSTIPGFWRLGDYEHIGQIDSKGKKISVTRYGETFITSGEKIHMMRGDIIKTGEEQAMVRLNTKDDIRIYPKSGLAVRQYDARNKRFDAQTTGKIRARISKRKKVSKIRFKTASAMVTVKGTDFQLLAAGGSTEVATVEGLVGLADPSGNGEVEISQGMKSSVAKGELPKPAEPIPPDELEELQKESLPVHALDIVKLNSINIITPEEGKSYSKLVLDFKIDPTDAMVQYTLDGKPSVLMNGSDLSHLPVGEHELVIKGLGEDAVSRSVSFVIEEGLPKIDMSGEVKYTITRGEKLILRWTKNLSRISVKIGENPLTAVITADDKRVVEIDVEPIFTGKLPPTATLIFSATSEEGKTATLNQSFPVIDKPVGPFILRRGDGKTFDYINAVDDLVILSDRDVKSWNLSIDGKPVQLVTPLAQPATTQPGATEKDHLNQRQLIIQPKTFAGVEDGQHQLILEATDQSGAIARIEKIVMFDFTPPSIDQQVNIEDPSKEDGAKQLVLENLLISEGEQVKFESTEPLSSFRIEYVDLGKTVDMMPPKAPADTEVKPVDQTIFLLGPEQLKGIFELKNQSTVIYHVSDPAGNSAQVSGQMSFQPKPRKVAPVVKKTPIVKSRVLSDREREERLRKAFINSVMLSPDSQYGQNLTAHRPTFLFDKSKLDTDYDEAADMEDDQVIKKLEPGFIDYIE